MFVSDRLVFLELQKTGGSHIRRLLEKYVEGRLVGKHNRVAKEYTDKYVVGSIRNPWDWYVSLWAFGVGGCGAIRARSTRGIDLGYYHRMLPRAMGKNRLTPAEFIVSLYHDANKPVQRWEKTYQDSSEPVQFRAWLKLLMDASRRYDVGEGYGFSPLSVHAGLFTYRYFRLFTTGKGIYNDQRLLEQRGMEEFDRDFNILGGVIRTESLEEDFIRVLGDAGYVLPDDHLQEIREKVDSKTNVSQRKSAKNYYDDDTIALVGMRDQYLIRKYGYEPPA